MAPHPPSVLTLLVTKGPCEGRTLQRRAGAAVRVGRVAKGNDLSVRDPGTSESHLSVAFLPPPAGRWAVTDLGSFNGTTLNGTPLVPTVPAPLSDGDLVKIGESTVIAVSIAIGAAPGPGPEPAATRRSARNAVAVAAAEKQGPVGPRRAAGRGAVEPAAVEMEEEEEAAAIPRRGRSNKAAATAIVPAQPQNARPARAAARRGETVGRQNDEEKMVRTARGLGRVTRASARNGRGDEEDETTDRTANASELVPVTGRGRATRGRRGRGRGTRKTEDAIVEKDEQEERDMADGRVNDGSGEDKVAAEEDKLDGISKASMEDEKMVDLEEDATITERAIEGKVNAQHAPADNGVVEEEEVNNMIKGGETEVVLEDKMDGVGEVGKNDKREAIGASGEKGHAGERTGRRRLEDMTLAEWFVRIEKFLLAKNEENAEKAVAEVRENHRRFCEHVKTLRKSPAP